MSFNDGKPEALMSEQRTPDDRVRRLEQKAEQAAARASAAKKRLQERCPHPRSSLVFIYAGVSSYRPGCDSHAMDVRCLRCGHATRNELVIHADL